MADRSMIWSKSGARRYQLGAHTPHNRLLAFALGEVGATAVAKACGTTVRAVTAWRTSGVPARKEITLLELCERLAESGRERVALSDEATEGPVWPLPEEQPPPPIEELVTSAGG